MEPPHPTRAAQLRTTAQAQVLQIRAALVLSPMARVPCKPCLQRTMPSACCHRPTWPAAQFPPSPALRSWSCFELRAFLHAWEKLWRACDLLQQAGSSHLTLRGSGKWLPVLLPWPREYAPGDTRPPPAKFPRRCHRTLAWWEIAGWEGKWDGTPGAASSAGGDDGPGAASSDGSLPVYDPSEDLDSRPSAWVCSLSSVVRGCPWPLDVVNDEGDDGLARRQQECSVVARRVAFLMRLSRELYDGGVTTAWCHRPEQRTVTTRSASWEESSPGVEEMFGLTSSESAQAAATAYLRDLLTSSLVVSMGSEHAKPWPVVLVALLSPGWIGGFISSAVSMG